jgi:hypothetical protein
VASAICQPTECSETLVIQESPGLDSEVRLVCGLRRTAGGAFAWDVLRVVARQIGLDLEVATLFCK